MPKPTRSDSLLGEFISEHIVIVLTALDTQVQTPDGDSAVVPMVAEGILFDYDNQFLLLGNDTKTSFSLVPIDRIGKIEMVDPLAPMDPNTPPIEEMN